MKRPALLIMAMFAMIALSGCSLKSGTAEQAETAKPVVSDQEVEPAVTGIADKCAAGGGSWLVGFEECEGIGSEWCAQEGGRFEECASACRHDIAMAENCTMQCIPVCYFPAKGEILADKPENSQYLIEDASVKLEGGILEKANDASSTIKSVTKIFGAPVYGDLNGDGNDDAALYLVRDDGGSGVLYYAAAAEKRENGYLGLDAVYLGDRIVPGKIEVKGRVAAFNFKERKADEPMTAQPSVSTVRSFTILDIGLREVPEAGVIDACLQGGGQLATSTCCATGLDMPDQCLIGACGCATFDSRETWVCDCGEGKCFDGKTCK